MTAYGQMPRALINALQEVFSFLTWLYGDRLLHFIRNWGVWGIEGRMGTIKRDERRFVARKPDNMNLQRGQGWATLRLKRIN